jgi:hypothetical protein
MTAIIKRIPITPGLVKNSFHISPPLQSEANYRAMTEHIYSGKS